MSTELVISVSLGVVMLIDAVVGLRLLRVASRTRRAPEFLIGLGLFTLGPVSQGLSLLAGAGHVAAGEVNVPVYALASAGSAIGMACVFGFVLLVFRPGVAWARVFTALATLTLVTASVGSIVSILRAPPELPSADVLAGWGLVSLAAFTVAFGWAALESGGYYAGARRRLRLGLVEPVVANRFLLWTVACGSAFLLGLCLTWFQTQGQALGKSVLPSLLTMIVSIVTGSTMYLAFLPPRAYLAWVTGPAREAGIAS